MAACTADTESAMWSVTATITICDEDSHQAVFKNYLNL